MVFDANRFYSHVGYSDFSVVSLIELNTITIIYRYNIPMQSSFLVSVVIITWNSKAYLSTCLDKLRAQTFRNFEVILVDNGSDDGALDGLIEKYPSLSLKTEQLETNHGFAVANNIGANLAHGDWLVLLNADAFPDPDWLEKMLQATVAYPEYSSFSSRQIQVNHPEYLDGAGDSYHVSGMAWRNKIGYPANNYALKNIEVFSSCGAAALFARDAFLEVGGFDENYFSYFEDVDLGFRLRLRGYRSLYVSDAIVHHVGSATFGTLSDFAFYHTHRNLVWTFYKNMPTSLFWRYLPAHIITNLIYVLYYTFRGRGKVLWKAKWDALRGLPKIYKQRKKIQKNRKATNAELLQVMERGWLQPFLISYRLQKVLASPQRNK